MNPILHISTGIAIATLRKFRDSDAKAAFVRTVATFIILRELEKRVAEGDARADRRLLPWSQLTSLSGYELKEEFVRVLDRLSYPSATTDFGNLAWISESTPKDVSVDLIGLARDFVQSYDFELPRDRNELAEQYELAIDEFVRSTRYSAEFSTPRSLAEFVVDLAQPRRGERIYDPCFGLGGFLVASARHVVRPVDSVSQDEPRQPETFISGAEISPTAAVIGWARLLLAGVKSPGLELVDSLNCPAPTNVATAGFDCILAAPPVGAAMSLSQVSRFRFVARTSESLFLQHILAQLRPGGRAVIVVPDSLLFRRGPEIDLRRYLLEEFTVESVWSLSPTAFRPHTQLKTSVVLIRKIGPTKHVLFVDERFTTPFFIESNKRPAASQPDLLVLDGDKSILAEAKYARSTPMHWKRLLETLMEATPEEEAKRSAGTGSTTLSIDTAEPNTVKMLIAMAAIRNWLVHSRWGMGQTQAIGAWRSFIDQRSIAAADIDWTALLQRSDKLLREFAWTVAVEKLADRRWELVAKQTGEDALEAFLSKLERVAPGTPRVRLADVADLFSGVRYKSSDLLDAQHLASSADHDHRHPPFIRVQDVGVASTEFSLSLAVKRPSTVLVEEASQKVPASKRLQTNDILLTASGTVGNVGIVPVELSGAVPAHSLIVIRCRTHFDPAALARLLQSSPYQAAIHGSASGSTIRHLRIPAAGGLAVPLLTPEHQLALTHGVLNIDVSDESLLGALSSIAQESYWVTFLLNDPSLTKVSLGADNTDSAEWWESVTALLRKPGQFREQMDSIQGDVFGRNFLTWLKHAQALLEIMELPMGLERYGALQAWDKSASSELVVGRDELAEHSRDGGTSALASQRFGALCEALISAAVAECRNIAASADLVVALQNAYTGSDGSTEIELRLNNPGVAPLWKLSLMAEPTGATLQIPLLSSGTTRPWTIQAAPNTLSEPVNLVVHWSGLLLDAVLKEGEVDISVDARPLHAPVSSQLFRVNPYIAGPPIDQPEMFFGRDDLIQNIRRLLRSDGPSTVILLEGNRRTGKTSLLKRLLDPQLLPRWIPIYCQFQGISGDAAKAGFSAQNLFRYVAKEMVEALVRGGCEPRPGILEPVLTASTALERKRRVQELVESIHPHEPFDHFRSILEAAIDSAGQLRLLLMLDEFDKIQEGIDNGVLSPQVPENIRFLFHTYNGLSGILTGYRRIKRLREEYWSVLFGIGKRIGISALDPDSARRLITKPVEEVLTYSSSAVDLMLHLCACQPFLLQSLGSAVFEECASTNQVNVTSTIVDSAADKLVHDNENFQTIFRNYISTERRRFLTCLIDRLADGPDRLTFELLSTELERTSVQYKTPSHLKDDIEELRDLEVIALQQDHGAVSYRLEVPLFSRWLRKNVDPESHRQAAKNEEEPR